MQNKEKRQYKKPWSILLIILLLIIVGLAISFGIYVFYLTKNINDENISPRDLLTQLQSSEKYELNFSGENNYWLGAAKPKITIFEFADFNCPLCKKSFSKIREISLNYKDNVKIIYKDFPVIANSVDLAMAGRCAGEQDLFWPMHDKLFQNQGNFNPAKTEEIIAIAKKAGVNINKFSSCLSQKKYLEDIQKDYADGLAIGTNGTPTWLINGYKINGDIPYETFIQIIGELIKNYDSN